MSQELIQDMDWIQRGSCRGQESINFFADNMSARGRAEQRAAVSVCENCPVIGECRDYALKYERFGIWGGMTEIQRTKERKRLNIETELDRFNLHTFLKRSNRPENTVRGTLSGTHKF